LCTKPEEGMSAHMPGSSPHSFAVSCTPKEFLLKNRSNTMHAGKRNVVAGGVLVSSVLAASAVAALLGTGVQLPAVRAAEGDEVEYTFGRPIKDGEQTYAWYRKTHADEAAKRYGVDPWKVGDGMDTWHWWCGVDNPHFWRKMTILAGKNYNTTGVHGD